MIWADSVFCRSKRPKGSGTQHKPSDNLWPQEGRVAATAARLTHRHRYLPSSTSRITDVDSKRIRSYRRRCSANFAGKIVRIVADG